MNRKLNLFNGASPTRLVSTRILHGISLALLALLIAGCGGKELREGFAEVYGTVTLDGKPLPNAQVVFETSEGDSYGRTDEDGYYVAEYSRGLYGAGTGEAKVRITTTAVFPDEDITGLEYDERSGDYRKPEQVPARYNQNSELTINITEDGAPYDFDLKSEPSKPAAE